jgi:hypothetical protein
LEAVGADLIIDVQTGNGGLQSSTLTAVENCVPRDICSAMCRKPSPSR